MRKTLLTLALAMAVNSAQAVTMTELLDGGSITVGDKLFSNWTEVFSGTSDPARTINPAHIDVTGIDDGGDYGLNFNILQGEFNVTGDGVFAYLDYSFGFKVSVLAPGMAINGVTLDLGFGAIASTNLNQDGTNLGMYILEHVGSASGLDDLASMAVEFSKLDDDASVSIVKDSGNFSPLSEIWVTKNILVWASLQDESASLGSFSQRFSQTAVPEPATLALFGLGLLGLGLARRRA